MIAHLGMYDRAETAAANDEFWSAIRANLGYGPAVLTRQDDPAKIWTDPDLLLSQTCGMPYRTMLHPLVTLIGTPDYGLPDCPAGHYNSVFVIHKSNTASQLSDFTGKTIAYNEPGSQSGWAAPMNHAIANNIMFGHFIKTGSHQNSARAVAEGHADITALDALTWQLIQNYDAFAADLRPLTTTSPTPTLPYITAKSIDPLPLFAAIQSAIADISQSCRDTLHLRGLVAISAQTYRDIPTPPAPDFVVVN